MSTLRRVIVAVVALQVCLLLYGVSSYLSGDVTPGAVTGGSMVRVSVDNTDPAVRKGNKRSTVSKIGRILTRLMAKSKVGSSSKEVIQGLIDFRMAKRAVTVLLISDWGLEGSKGLAGVARQMERICEARRPGSLQHTGSDPKSVAEAKRRRQLGPVTALASLGDNFYHYGLRSAGDPLFDRVFGAHFSRPGTCVSRLDMWGVAGNHCYRGSVDALLQRDAMTTARRASKPGAPPPPLHSHLRPRGWRMPARSYAVELPSGRVVSALRGPNDPQPVIDGPLPRSVVQGASLGRKSVRVRLLFVDTNPLSCFPKPDNPRSRECSRMAKSLRDANTPKDIVRWLRRAAKEAHDDPDTDWFAVMGHHPAASNVRLDSARIAEHLLPSLRDFARSSKFAGFFAGHDHALQHIRRAGVDVFAVGGGGGPLQPLRKISSRKDTPKWKPPPSTGGGGGGGKSLQRTPRPMPPMSQRETLFSAEGFGFMEVRATSTVWTSIIRDASGEVVHRLTKKRKKRKRDPKTEIESGSGQAPTVRVDKHRGAESH